MYKDLGLPFVVNIFNKMSASNHGNWLNRSDISTNCKDYNIQEVICPFVYKCHVNHGRIPPIILQAEALYINRIYHIDNHHNCQCEPIFKEFSFLEIEECKNEEEMWSLQTINVISGYTCNEVENI